MPRSRNMASILNRAIIADGWRARIVDAVKPALMRQVRQAVLEVESGGRDFGKYREQWEAMLFHTQRPLALKMAVDGYRLAEAELGSRVAQKELAMIALAGKATWFEDEPESVSDVLIRKRLEPKVDEYLTRTSKLETETSIKQITGLWREQVAGNATSSEIARSMYDAGTAWSAQRADLMARTLTIRTYNEGAISGYRDAGIERMEWLATGDELTCPQCGGLHGEIADIGRGFSDGTDQPPAHPNCRCAVMPVFEEVAA